MKKLRASLNVSLAKGFGPTCVAALLLLSGCNGGQGNKELASGNVGISLVIASGNNQYTDPGQKFPNPLIVKTVDPLGNPVPGVSVSFAGDGTGNLSVLAAALTSDVSGAVSANVVAPSTLNSSFTVNASLSGNTSSVTFNLHTYPNQLITISDGPTYDYGTQAVGSSTDYTFNVTNTGTTTAQSLMGQVDDTPFTFKGGTYPGTGGNCGTSLAGGASCKIVVTFAPTTVNFFSSNIEIHYNDGTVNRVAERAIEGTSADLGKLVISEDPSYDYGSLAIGGSLDHTFSMQNVGTLDATSITSVGFTSAFSFKGGTYPGTGGTCGTTVAAGATCTLVVTFHPTALGLVLDKINLSYFNGSAADFSTRNIQGTGAAPALLNISDGPTYDYGTQAVNSSVDHTFTVTNNGNSAATTMATGTMLAPFRFKGNVYPGTGGTCADTLAVGATCTVVVTFSPTSAGLQTGTVNIDYFNGAVSMVATVNVQGTGANLGYLTINPSPLYDYGSHPVGSLTDFSFTVNNTGTGDATSVNAAGLLAPFSFKGSSYPGTGGTCGATIASGSNCTVVVTFAPTAAGSFSDTIQLNYFDGSQTQHALRNITGTGVSAAVLTISNNPLYDYGTHAVNSSTDFTFTVSNTGGVTAAAMAGAGLSTPFAFKGGTYPGTGGTCNTSLAPGGTCAVVVTFAPSAAGSFSSALQMNYFDGAQNQTASRNIQGAATNQAILTISDGPTYDYGTLAMGSSADKTFTVSNTGGTMATTIASSALSAPFSFKGGTYPGTGGNCAASLAPAATCTLVVTFAPTATGLATGTVQLSYYDGTANQTATRAIQGTGSSVANLTISDGPTYDFGLQAVGTQTNKTFTVSNTGGVSATAMAGGGLSAPFGFMGGTYPGTGGTCAATLAPAATCTVVVTFAPTSTGAASSTINIGFNNGTTAQTSSRAVVGTGTTPAMLTISDGPTYDYGTQSIGSNTDHIFTITNSGGLSATALADLGLTGIFHYKGGAYPGTGGTCSATLSASATCNLVVTFSPTASGIFTNTIQISYNDGTTTQTATRAVQGTAANAAFLTLSDSPLYNYGNVPVGASADHTFTVQNTGAVSATSIAESAPSAPFTYKGGSYPGAGGTCGATLAAAASCTVVVTYAPPATGANSDAVTLNYYDGTANQTVTRPIQGTGTAPAALVLSDSPLYDYGTHAAGSITDHSFTVNNNGGVSATAMAGLAFTTGVFYYKGGTYPGTGGTCGASLAAGANCSVVVTYAPTAAGTQNDTVKIQYNDGVNPTNSAARNVQGEAAIAAFLSISNGPVFDFGTQPLTSITEQIFTVTNSGGLTATVMAGSGLAAPFAFNGGSYPGTNGTCGLNLAAGGNCTIDVTFTPTAVGPFTATITVSYNDGLQAQQATRGIQGTGATAANLSISDAPMYNYGTLSLGSSADHTFTVTNNGGVPATALAASGLSAPFTFKGGTYPGTGGSCAASLNGGSTCTIIVDFAPAATGLQSGTLTVNYNNGLTGTSLSENVQGTGAATALLTLSDGPSYDFGNVALGNTGEHTFTVSNTGGFTASSLSGTGLSAPFTFKGGAYPGTGGTCGTSLAASTTCTVIVDFNPTATGASSSAVQINYNDGTASQSSVRDVTGTGVSAALLTISDGPLYDFGTDALGSNTDHTFTVNNGGDVAATTVAPLALAAPFSFKGGTFPGTGGTCGATLNAQSSCTFVATFSPTTLGLQTGVITLNYNNGVSAQTTTRNIQGTGANPAVLTISDSPSYDFGTRSTGSSTNHTFTVSNTGGVTASSVVPSAFSSPFSYLGGAYPGTGGTCGTTLAGGSTCTIVVDFTPMSIGSYSATMTTSYFDGVNPQTLNEGITGVGATLAFLTISDGPTFDYGLQATGSSTDHTFTVSNIGGMAASSLAPSAFASQFQFKGGAYPGTGGTCGSTLNPSATCNIVVSFTPVSNGTFNDNITINYNDGSNANSVTRAITGQAASPALLTISDGPTYNYGVIANGNSLDHTFAVNNTGGVSATALTGTGLSAPFTFKGGTYPGTGGTCGATIPNGSGCNIVVTFAPTTTGLFNSTVDLNYNDGTGAKTSSRNVQGTGAAPAVLTISDGPIYDFGAQAIGSTTTHSFTITNTGGVAATSVAGTGLAAPFAFAGGSYPGVGGTCGTIINNGTTCTVVASFSPTAVGSQSGTMNIGYNDGVGAQTASRGVQGTSNSSALLVISNGPTYDYGSHSIGSLTDMTFSVQNTGNVSATSMADGMTLAAPFTFKGGTYPGTGGTCSTFLNSLATCTVVVEFAPTATGVQNGTITLAYFDGVASQTSVRAVTGTGVNPGLLTISDAPTYDFGTVAVGGTNDHVFTVSNTGGFAASAITGGGLTAPFSFTGGSFPGTAGNCGTTLNAGANCTIDVVFSPTAAGASSSTIQIGYNDGTTSQTSTRGVQGTGALAAFLTISDGPTFDYGTVAIGATADHTFTVNNTGGVSATGVVPTALSAPFTFKGGTYPGTGGTCSANVASGASCTVVVSFVPTATGVSTGTITLNYNNSLSAQTATRAIQGTGNTPAVLTISDGPTYDYGTVAVGAVSDHTFTVNNSGGMPAASVAPVALSAPFSFKGGTYPGTGGTCGATVAGLGSCTVVVEFGPTTSGVLTGTVSLNYNDGANPQVSSRPIQGTGAALAVVTISNAPLFDYGTQALGSSTDQTFTLSNTGGVPATALTGTGLSAPFSFKGGSYPGSGGTCVGSLANGSTCTIVVTFSPTVSGLQTAAIQIDFNNGNSATNTTRSIQGTGATAAFLTISDSPFYNYGTQAVGSTTDHTFTVQNTGSITASAMAGSGLSAPFTFKGGSYPGTGGTCGTSLANGSSCAIVVTFAPTAAALSNSTINIAYNDGAQAQTSSRNVQGTGAAPALLQISDQPTFDFGTQAVGGTASHTFTVTNAGGFIATGMVQSSLVAPFSYTGGTYPGTGGTCGMSLSASATCTVAVSFSPVSSGLATGTFSINYFDGAGSQVSSDGLQGTGANAAFLTISDGATFDYGSVAIGATVSHTFTVNNTGGLPATAMAGSGLSLPFSFTGGAYPGTGGNCPTTLGNGASCTIVVSFAPSASGSFNSTITIGYNDGTANQSAQRAVTGTGATAALLTISDGPTYNYGTQAVGSVTDHVFTVTNSGTSSATAIANTSFTAPFTYKGGTYPGTGGTCGTSLGGGANCSIVVSFVPISTGAYNDTITLNYNSGAAATNAQRAVTGVATSPAVLTVTDANPYDYGMQALSSTTDHAFTVNNSGGVAATALAGSGLSAPFTFKGGSYPGIGGTCGTTIASGANCTVVVSFTPTTAGLATGTFALAYNDGANPQSVSEGVKGTGSSAASLTISDGPTYNYGTIAVNTSTDHTFVITNSGTVSATSMADGLGLSAPFSFKGGTYPGTGGTCSTSLAAAGTCSVVVTYAPTATGAQSSTVDVSYYDGALTQQATRAVQGTAAAPATLVISDSPTYDYGSQAVGSSTDHTFTVNNTGGLTANAMAGAGLTAPFSFKGGTYPGTGGTCGASLSNGSSCTMVVTYAPTAAGSQTSTVNVNYNDGAASQTASRGVQGTGVLAAFLTISDGPTFDYGTVAIGATLDHTFTVNNTGGISASSMGATVLTSAFNYKGGSYPGTGGTCSASLASGGNCSIVVTFAPTATGVVTDTITLNYNNSLSAQAATRAVQGTGNTPAVLTVSDGPTYDFGTVAVGAVADHTFTVSNSGGMPATGVAPTAISAPFSFKGGTYPGTGGTCTATVAGLGSCTVVVEFAPTTTGVQTGTLSMNYNDGVTSQVSSRAIQGTGAANALITISNSPLFDYGTQPLGSNTDQSFTLSNTGGVPAVSMAGAGLAAPFAFKGGSYPGTGGTCAATLANGSTCSIVVTFSPTTSGLQTGTIQINYNNGTSATNSTRNIQGTGATTAFLAISDSPLYDYGTQADGSSTDHTFTVQNTGSTAATAMAGSGLAAPFSFKGGSYPGTGGTCATSLANGSSCTMVVTFAPTGTGPFNGTLNLAYNDGLQAQTSSRNVQGTGVTPALLQISDAPTYDFGNQPVGATVNHTFTVTNAGGDIATGMVQSALTAPFSYTGGTYPGTGGTCGMSLSASSTCTVVVSFAPVSTGLATGTFSFNYFNGAGPQVASVGIQGTGVNAAFLTISDGATFDYGTVAIGATLDHTFTINNTGGNPATAMAGSGLALPFSFKGGSYPGTGGTCTTSLANGANCTIVASFAPTASGPFNSTVTIAYNDGTANQSAQRAVVGTGATAALLTISDGPTYDYGTQAVGSVTDHIFTVTNSGAVSATGIANTAFSGPFTYKDGTYPGTGGTCGTSLSGGANCSIVVSFVPVTTGAYNDTITLNYNNGAAATNAQRAVTGVGTSPALLTISGANPYDYGTQALGSTTDHSFTVSNTGGVSATSLAGSGLSAPFTFKGGSYPGTGGTCGATLANAATCTVVVSFTPSAAVTSNGTFTLAYTNGVSAQNVSEGVKGTGNSAASLTISDGPTYNYGTIAVNTSADHTFVVTNTGSVSATSMADGLTLAAPFSFKGGTYPGTGGTCSTSLAAAGTCNVVVTYAPTATGAQSGTLDISYFDGSLTQQATRAVTGTAAAPAVLTISDGPTYDYGTQAIGSSVDHSFTVTNTGGLSATAMAGSGLAAPFSFKGGTYPGTGGTCGATLPNGTNCTVVVTYAPTASGLQTSTADLNYNDGAANQVATRPVQGTGVLAASLTISDGPTFDFGTQATGSSTDHTFSVTNVGGAQATAMAGVALAAPFTFKGGNYPGTGGTCSATLAASTACTVVVTFAPTANGISTATLQVNYNNGSANTNAQRALQGTGANPAVLTVSDGPTYDYGNVAVAASADHTFTVTNSGGVSAASVSGSGLSAPYSFKGGSYPGTGGTCGSVVPAGTNCSVVVTFSPVASGAQTGTLVMNYTDGVTSQSATRALTGTGVNPAFLSISDGPTYNYGSQALGSSTDHTFTVTNSGGESATAMGGIGLAAPFSFKGGGYPGTGGTCGTTLNTSTTCTIVVTYSPTALGTMSSTININYFDGGQTQSALRGVEGTGAGAAVLTISDGPTYDYGTQAVNSFTDHAFTITNTGSVGASALGGSVSGGPYAFKGGTFPGTGGTCASTLAFSATCTVVLTFNPTALGTFNDTMIINYNDGANPQSVARNVTGTGANPGLLTIAPGPSFNYGTQGVGSVTTQLFTLTNIGGVPTTTMSVSGLVAPFALQGGSWPGTTGTCGTSLAAGANCTIAVSFSPLVNGLQTDTATVNYYDGAANQTLNDSLSGTGAPVASLVISDGPTFDFGTQALNSTTTHTFNVDNTGGVTATAMTGAGLSTPFKFHGSSGYPGTGGTCGASLTAGSTCTIVVDFAPVSLGSYNQTVQLGYFDTVNSQTATRPVTGVGAAAAVLTISNGPTYNYGSAATGSTNAKTFSITNSGGVPATALAAQAFSLPFTFKGGSYPGTGGTCATVLANGSSCNIVVEFDPTTVGTFSATVAVNYYDGAANQSASIGVTGTATAPALLTISDEPTYNYGILALTASASHTFTVTNNGGTAATTISPSSFGAPYSFTGGGYPGTGGTCGGTLAFGSSCTVVVTFNPTSSGSFTANLILNYYDGAANQAATEGLSGQGGSAAVLTISDSDPYNYGTQALGSSTDKTFTISNSGAVAASNISGISLSAPYSWKGGSYPGTGATCPAAGGSLVATASCTVVVTFSPTATGTFNGTVQLSYNDSVQNQVASRNVTGTGATQANITISNSPTYNFGSTPVGAPLSFSFTLTNNGGVNATSIQGLSLSSPFQFSGGTFPGTGGTCTATLAPAGTCTVAVTYLPTAAVTSNATMQINYNNGAAGTSATIGLQGTGIANALLTISNGPTYNYGTQATGSTTTMIFTVTNSGGFNATSVSSTLSGMYRYAGGSFPGTGGNCTSTLTNGSSCSIAVNFVPTTTGTLNKTLTIAYYNGASTVNTTLNLTGVGASPASLTINLAPYFDYGAMAVNSVTNQIFNITNSGGVASTLMTGPEGGTLVAPFAYTGGAYPGTGLSTPCGATLAAGSSCQISVAFSPTSVGSYDQFIQINYFDGANNQNTQREVKGTGASAASLTWLQGPTFDYGTVALGIYKDQTFTLQNSGSVLATGLSLSGLTSDFSVQPGGTCGTTLAAGTQCTLTIRFAPSTVGTQSPTFAMAYYNGAANQSANLPVTATGASRGYLTITPASYSFGSEAEGSVTTTLLTITNSSTTTAASNISGSGLGGTSYFDFTGGAYPGINGTCPTGVSGTIAAGASCQVEVEFAPQGTGAFSATMTISYFDSVANQSATAAFTGSGSFPADIKFSPTSWNFGAVPDTAVVTATIQVQNDGGVTATGINVTGLNAPFTFVGGSYPGTGGTCGATLAPTIKCNLVVQFAPTTLGFQSTSLVFNFNTGAGPNSATMGLSGTGATTATLSFSQASPYNFGTQATGSQTNLTLTVTNSGGVAATSLFANGMSTEFYFAGGSYPGTGGTCGASLAAGSTCNLIITFDPDSISNFTTTMNLLYNNGLNGSNISITFKGSGQGPANITFNPTSKNWGTVAVGSTTTNNVLIQLQNLGSLSATGISSANPAAPFAYTGGAYPGLNGTCGTTLANLASCYIEVTYNPTVAETDSGTVVINYNNGVSATTANLALSGTAAAPAVLTLSNSPTLDFGTVSVGQSNALSLTITNTGGVSATFSPPSLSAPYGYNVTAYPGQTGTCTGTLAAGANCTVQLAYTPTTAGTQGATYSVAYFDGNTLQSVSRNLTGTAVAPALLVYADAPLYDFGAQTVNSVTTRSLTINNTGSYDASSISSSTLSGNITYAGGSFPGTGGTCSSADIPGLGSCTIVLQFQPTSVTTSTATLTLTYNNGFSTQTASLNLQGEGSASGYCSGKLANAPFAGGSGISTDPYTICTTTQLMQVGTSPAAYFEQRDNIDFTGVTFTPIGTSGSPFTGTFDGKNWTINGISENGVVIDVGLFGATSGSAAIKNVRVSGVNFTTSDYTGGLVGNLGGGSITNSFVLSGTVTGGSNTGGLVGNAAAGTTITRSGASDTVSGTSEVGGLVGNGAGNIDESFAKGNVSGSGNDAGGLVGHYATGTVTDSYASGNVAGTSGGIAGLIGNMASGSVARAYSRGFVSGSGTLGGLIGSSAGSVSNSYWSTSTSGQASSAGGTGETTTGMLSIATYSTWNFSRIWRMEGSYPGLSYLNHSTPPIAPSSLAFSEYFNPMNAAWGSAVVDTGNTFNPTTATSSIASPSGWGSQCLQVTLGSSPAGSRDYIGSTMAAMSSSWYSFEFAVSNWGTLSPDLPLASTYSSSDSMTAWEVRVKNVSGTYKLSLISWFNGSSNTITWPASGGLSLNQVYSVEVYWDVNLGSYVFRIDGNEFTSGGISYAATTIDTQYIGPTAGFSSVGTSYFVDKYLVSKPSAATVTHGVQSTITLTYSDADGDQAISCNILDLTNATVTQPCACNSGTCTVGITGTAAGVGGFNYTIQTNGQNSNAAAVGLTVQ